MEERRCRECTDQPKAIWTCLCRRQAHKPYRSHPFQAPPLCVKSYELILRGVYGTQTANRQISHYPHVQLLAHADMSVWPCATATKPLQKILALRVRLSVSGRHSRSPCPGQHRRYSSKYIPASASTAVTDKRFDILFCGSDEFSATSLKAVLGAPGEQSAIHSLSLFISILSRISDLWRSVRVVVPHVKRKRRPKAGQVVELGKIPTPLRSIELPSLPLGAAGVLAKLAEASDLTVDEVPEEGIGGYQVSQASGLQGVVPS